MPPTTTSGSPSNQGLAAAADDLLVQRAVDGDVAAFRTLITRHAPIMRAYIARIVSSYTDADDILQDTYVVAWKKLPTLRDPSQAKPWMIRIATRRAFAHLKKRPPETVFPADHAATGHDPEETTIRNAQLRELSKALDALPEDQRQCWLLREVAGLSYQDIADAMGVTTGQARGKLARARVNITVRMEGWR